MLTSSQSLNLIAEAYSEISALKLQRIRHGIERNRVFFAEMQAVYRMVKVAAQKHHLKTDLPRTGAISILLTSNHRFYGTLEHQLIQFFTSNTTQFKTNRIAVGKTGIENLRSYGSSLLFQPVVFKDDMPTGEELRKLVEIITGYQQIMVYYSRMHTVLVQEPHIIDILQKPPESYTKTTGRTFNYIFEPELEKILKFFDSQITTLLLEQTFLEAELARTASRLISMDSAQMKADKQIKEQQKMLFSAQRSIVNSRMLNTITATMGKKEVYGV